MTHKIFFIGLLGIIFSGCSSSEEPEVMMKVSPEKRKPKHEYMQPEEPPIEDKKTLPIAPQVGIRIPLGK